MRCAGVEGRTSDAGLKLDSTGQRAAGGRLYFQTAPLDYSLPTSLPAGKADNQILGVVAACPKSTHRREVVLVSKDINMRVKARALGLNAEDYQNDKTLDDGDLLYAGVLGAAARLLVQERQERRKLAKRCTHVLPHRWPDRAATDDQSVCVL